MYSIKFVVNCLTCFAVMRSRPHEVLLLKRLDMTRCSIGNPRYTIPVDLVSNTSMITLQL